MERFATEHGRPLAPLIVAPGAALAVDEVLGARTLRDAKLGALPPLLDGVTSGAAEWVASVDEQLAFVLRTARLVPEAAWDALEAARQT